MTNRYSTAGDIDTEAQYWVLRSEEEDVSESEILQRDAWLSSNPDNRRVYHTYRQLSTDLQGISGLHGKARLEDLARFDFSDLEASEREEDRSQPVVQRLSERLRGIGQYAHIAAAAMVALLLVSFLIMGLPGGTTLADRTLSTGTGEIREFRLPDGSVIVLGARSTLHVAFGSDERRVNLQNGDAYFDVESDAAAPFQVYASGIVVRAVGTEFEVRKRLDRLEVAIAEGIVEVSRQRAPDVASNADRGSDQHDRAVPVRDSVRLTRGQKVAAAATGLSEVQQINTEKVSSWRNGRLFYDDAELGLIVSDFNRYFDGRIELTDDRLEGLKITASFRIENIENTILSLENILPVRVDRDAPGVIRISPDDR